MTPVRVQVLFFGLLRDLMGVSQESLDLGMLRPEGIGCATFSRTTPIAIRA